MSHTRLWSAAAIIALVVLTGFVLSVPHARDVTETQQVSIATTTPKITVNDSYKKGMHTITGSVEMPNACAVVSAEARIAPGDASSTPSILIALTMADDGGVCLQVPTTATFKTTVATTTARLPLVVTINGAIATTTTP